MQPREKWLFLCGRELQGEFIGEENVLHHAAPECFCEEILSNSTTTGAGHTIVR
jgi:hypothetical protein